jgi:hypothetical protein
MLRDADSHSKKAKKGPPPEIEIYAKIRPRANLGPDATKGEKTPLVQAWANLKNVIFLKKSGFWRWDFRLGPGPPTFIDF